MEVSVLSLDDAPTVPLVKVSAKVPSDLLDSFTGIARRGGRNFSAEIRRAMRLYVLTNDETTLAPGGPVQSSALEPPTHEPR